MDSIFETNCVDIYNPKTIRSTMSSIYPGTFCDRPDLQDVLHGSKAEFVLMRHI